MAQTEPRVEHHSGLARVLVADDHQPMLDRVVALLSREFTVIGAVTDGAQLVDADAALHPDVLVVDISMPVMGGLEAARRIRGNGSVAVVVCLTAHQEPDILESAWDAGALGFVTKACMATDLVPAIRAALGGRRFVSAPMIPAGPSLG